MEKNPPQTIHNVHKSRFELQAETSLATLSYQISDGIIIFTSTFVPSTLEGRGYGSQLVQAGLEYARQEQLKVRSLCWFVDGYIKRHPEYQALL